MTARWVGRAFWALLFLLLSGTSRVQATVIDQITLNLPTYRSSASSADRRCFVYDSNNADVVINDPRFHPLYAYQPAVLIRDELAEKDWWLYADACVEIEADQLKRLHDAPSIEELRDFINRLRESNESWTNFSYGLTEGEEWYYPEHQDPSNLITQAMRDPRDPADSLDANKGTVVTRDWFVDRATVDSYRDSVGVETELNWQRPDQPPMPEIGMPSAYNSLRASSGSKEAMEQIRMTAPVQIPLGIQGPELLQRLRDANFSMAPQLDDRPPGSVEQRVWAGYAHDLIRKHDLNKEPFLGTEAQNLERVFALVGYLHMSSVNEPEPVRELMQAMTWRNPGYEPSGTGPSGIVAAWYLFPHLILKDLLQEPCEDGRVVVTGRVENVSPSTEKVLIQYSWDGLTWEVGDSFDLEPYQNNAKGAAEDQDRTFRMVINSPAGKAPLQVRVKPDPGTRMDWAWDRGIGEEQLELAVTPCPCDLAINEVRMAKPANPGGFAVTVVVQRYGCRIEQLVRLDMSVAGTPLAPVFADLRNGRKLVAVTFWVGPQSCGGKPNLQIELDSFDQIWEEEPPGVANNRWIGTAEIAPCFSNSSDCPPDMPPDLCVGSIITDP